MGSCDYKRIISDNDIMVWSCTACGHKEYVPFRFKDWKCCPYCCNIINEKDGVKTPME